MNKPIAKIPVNRRVLILPEVLVYLEKNVDDFNIFDITDAIEEFYGTNYSPCLIMVSKDHKMIDAAGYGEKMKSDFNKFIDGLNKHFYEHFDHNGVIELWTDEIIE